MQSGQRHMAGSKAELMGPSQARTPGAEAVLITAHQGPRAGLILSGPWPSSSKRNVQGVYTSTEALDVDKAGCSSGWGRSLGIYLFHKPQGILGYRNCSFRMILGLLLHRASVSSLENCGYASGRMHRLHRYEQCSQQGLAADYPRTGSDHRL